MGRLGGVAPRRRQACNDAQCRRAAKNLGRKKIRLRKDHLTAYQGKVWRNAMARMVARSRMTGLKEAMALGYQQALSYKDEYESRAC